MQNISAIKDFLLWSAIINYLVLVVWFCAFVFLNDFLRKLHGRWFDLEPKTFDALHYAGMAIYKILVLVFNVVPFFAICLAGF
jgi:hypothetical protein